MKKLLSIAFVLLISTVMSFAEGDIRLGQNYPNPTKEITYIDVEFSSSEATLVLSNILGETVQMHRLDHSGSFVINVTDIPEGVYFYTLEADGQKVTKRLTVKR